MRRRHPPLSDLNNTQLTGLSVREDARIVALERIVQDVTSDTVEHLLLRCEMGGARVDRVEAMVEGERLRLFAVFDVMGGDKLEEYIGIIKQVADEWTLTDRFCPWKTDSAGSSGSRPSPRRSGCLVRALRKLADKINGCWV